MRRSVIRGRAGSRPRFGGHPSRLFGHVAASEPQRCAARRGLVAPPLVRKSRRLLAAAVCWPPAPPWSRSRAWSSVGRCGPPGRPPGPRRPVCGLALPPRWGALCGGCRGAGRAALPGGGGVYLPPAPAWWPLLLVLAWVVAAASPPAPCPPPPSGGRGNQHARIGRTSYTYSRSTSSVAPPSGERISRFTLG